MGKREKKPKAREENGKKREEQQKEEEENPKGRPRHFPHPPGFKRGAYAAISAYTTYSRLVVRTA